MKKQILSLIALVLVGIFVIGCTRGGVEEAAAVPPDGDAMDDTIADDTIVNDMENETAIETAEGTTAADTTDAGDTTTGTGTQDTTGTTY